MPKNSSLGDSPLSDADKAAPAPHWSADEFRKNAHEAIEWIIQYWKDLESLPVLSKAKAGDLYNSIEDHAPNEAEDFSSIMEDMSLKIVPALTHWQSPNFFAYFPCGYSAPSIIAELFSAALGVQGMLWETSPACTELETKVLDWLVDLLALPQDFHSSIGGGVIQDTASSAVLCAVLAAKQRMIDKNQELSLHDLQSRLVAYCSTETHSSLAKAIAVCGLESAQLRQVVVDSNYSMNSAILRNEIQKDLADNKLPFFVCATLGTTSSNAMDPIEKIGEISQAENLWLHVDGAMSGSASICPEFRYLINGMSYADSYCFNPHKWMLTNFDCSCFYLKKREELIRALSILPEYLKNKATLSGEVIDYRDWHIPLGRRFRALKLWFVLRSYGAEGVRKHIRSHVQWAKRFASWVEEDERFELMAPSPLNLVCFRYIGSNEANKSLLSKINSSGQQYLTHTILNEKYTLRMSIGATMTTEQHVTQCWERIQSTLISKA